MLELARGEELTEKLNGLKRFTIEDLADLTAEELHNVGMTVQWQRLELGCAKGGCVGGNGVKGTGETFSFHMHSCTGNPAHGSNTTTSQALWLLVVIVANMEGAMNTVAPDESRDAAAPIKL
jgi:hypothetical protein